MTLSDVQHGMADAIVRNDSTHVIRLIAATTSVCPSERLGVYHDNVTGNLVAALSDTFPATRKLVGDQFFGALARQFIPAYPPAQANLNLYGRELPGFVEEYPPADSLPYLADVARFEWLWNESYLAADDSPLLKQEVARLTREDYLAVHLTLRNSARLMASDYPVDAIRRFCEEDGESDVPDINAGSIFLLIVRPELEVGLSRLSRAEYLMLLSLSIDNTFEDSAAHALREDPSFDLAAFLAKHFALGTFGTLR